MMFVKVPVSMAFFSNWSDGSFLVCSITVTLGGSKVDSAFHPSEVDKMSTRSFWKLSGKKVNCLLKVAQALRQSNPIHKKGPFFLKI